MIYHNLKEMIGEYHAGKATTAIYRGLELVWQAVRSCFGRGIWYNEKPWLNEDGWKLNQN